MLERAAQKGMPVDFEEQIVVAVGVGSVAVC